MNWTPTSRFPTDLMNQAPTSISLESNFLLLFAFFNDDRRDACPMVWVEIASVALLPPQWQGKICATIYAVNYKQEGSPRRSSLASCLYANKATAFLRPDPLLYNVHGVRSRECFPAIGFSCQGRLCFPGQYP